MYEEFKGRTAIVTGGGAGTGRAIVHCLAQYGCNVAIWGNDIVNCVATMKELSKLNYKIMAYPTYCDVSDKDNVQNALTDTLKYYGEVHYLINCAGISEVDFIIEIKEHHWDKILGVNAKGTMLTMQAIARYWIEEKQPGNIVNIVSESCFSWHTMCGSYVASKAAQNAITKVAAREFAKHNIRVNAVHPSITEGTNLTKYLDGEFRKQYGWSEEEAQKAYLSKIPMGRYCNKEDVTKAVIWLLSDESSYCTGNDLMVSGGQSI
ncbi:MAG: SDR family oxidoreductase [Candidatus Woesearchaeota archaeon]